MGFSELDLSPEVLQAVSDAGYSIPTPIQEQAIPHVKNARDVLGLRADRNRQNRELRPADDRHAGGRPRAGAHAALADPRADARTGRPRSPRISRFTANTTSLTMALLIGGESFVDQERKLDRGVDVLIATPGRLLDLHGRGKILLIGRATSWSSTRPTACSTWALSPMSRRIVGLLPKNRQTLFFSATMPPEIRKLADAFLKNPVEISVAPPASPAATGDPVARCRRPATTSATRCAG